MKEAELKAELEAVRKKISAISAGKSKRFFCKRLKPKEQGMKKQYITFDLANGQATVLNEMERREGRRACYTVDRHIRRNWQGEICGEYFTVRKTRTK